MLWVSVTQNQNKYKWVDWVSYWLTQWAPTYIATNGGQNAEASRRL
jgi:hypothetical protein